MTPTVQYNHESALDLDETCAVRTIKAGTLKKLVEHLVPAFLRGDLSYIHTFLSNYRAFATTQQVLDLLFLRYGCVLPYSDGDGGPQDQLKDAISFILGTFLEEYSEDFDEPPDFLPLKMLKAYAQLNMPGSVIECQANLLLAQLEHPEPAETEQEAQVSPLELAQDPPRASPPEPAPDTSGALTLDEGPDPHEYSPVQPAPGPPPACPLGPAPGPPPACPLGPAPGPPPACPLGPAPGPPPACPLGPAPSPSGVSPPQPNPDPPQASPPETTPDAPEDSPPEPSAHPP
ncbi:ral guanine nucleotide dissociation stimulator-like isoform X2 [Loxodonta africana]|uniref:ral guanine nucleotide dissociation stimulator-like isoform X2 n=1 Tax=Loxodonta africana TaxID=9785 RepID=UPI0030CCB63C